MPVLDEHSEVVADPECSSIGSLGHNWIGHVIALLAEQYSLQRSFWMQFKVLVVMSFIKPYIGQGEVSCRTTCLQLFLLAPSNLIGQVNLGPFY